MNTKFTRKNYGILPLSAAALQGVQLEWAMVEPATARRFINFPLADDAVAAPAEAARPLPRPKPPLAA